MNQRLLACVLAFGPLAAAAQTLYKCVLDTKTVYQSEPCPPSARQDTLQAPPPGPTKSSSAKDSPAGDAPAAREAPPSELDTAIDVMAGYRACADAILEWEGAHRTAYEAWRIRNGSLVSRVENDVDSQRKYSQKVQANRTGTSRTCANVLAVIKPGDTEFMKDVRNELGARKNNR